mmetsp:Transcript_22329/g.55019  ORF Transcript_22329/g.55019 Transcript_22329/m.55019 type:complete len:298 (+) Transcript_22329:2028-2921(+)
MHNKPSAKAISMTTSAVDPIAMGTDQTANIHNTFSRDCLQFDLPATQGHGGKSGSPPQTSGATAASDSGSPPSTAAAAAAAASLFLSPNPGPGKVTPTRPDKVELMHNWFADSPTHAVAPVAEVDTAHLHPATKSEGLKGEEAWEMSDRASTSAEGKAALQCAGHAGPVSGGLAAPPLHMGSELREGWLSGPRPAGATALPRPPQPGTSSLALPGGSGGPLPPPAMNFKGMLNEVTMRMNQTARYTTLQVHGTPSHAPRFVTTVEIALGRFTGEASTTKKAAEHAAAFEALKHVPRS